MHYNATVKFSYVNDTETSNNKYFPELVDKQTITIEAPAQDLNVYQYYELFKGFLRAVGFTEYNIADGALRLAFSDENDSNQTKKLMEEYELQDKQLYSTEDYENLQETREQLESEITDLKAKLSRALNPDNPNYTDEEIDALHAYNVVNVDTLKKAYQVCNDCGNEYGTYSSSCSSRWVDKCDVCGKISTVTESRDYNYLEKGIRQLSK
jgi:hypothetical protein